MKFCIFIHLCLLQVKTHTGCNHVLLCSYIQLIVENLLYNNKFNCALNWLKILKLQKLPSYSLFDDIGKILLLWSHSPLTLFATLKSTFWNCVIIRITNINEALITQSTARIYFCFNLPTNISIRFLYYLYFGNPAKAAINGPIKINIKLN